VVCTIIVMQVCSADDALKVLQNRQLGVVRLRHLPKQAGMRPISNLSCPTLQCTRSATGAHRKGCEQRHRFHMPRRHAKAPQAACGPEDPLEGLSGQHRACKGLFRVSLLRSHLCTSRQSTRYWSRCMRFSSAKLPCRYASMQTNS
jgi:hypothetical protein